jgi:hypothetical protein
MKHDMPNEWRLLKKNRTVDLKIDKSRLPYMAQSLNPTIESVLFIAKIKMTENSFSLAELTIVPDTESISIIGE